MKYTRHARSARRTRHIRYTRHTRHTRHPRFTRHTSLRHTKLTYVAPRVSCPATQGSPYHAGTRGEYFVAGLGPFSVKEFESGAFLTAISPRNSPAAHSGGAATRPQFFSLRGITSGDRLRHPTISASVKPTILAFSSAEQLY